MISTDKKIVETKYSLQWIILKFMHVYTAQTSTETSGFQERSRTAADFSVWKGLKLAKLLWQSLLFQLFTVNKKNYKKTEKGDIKE